MENIEKQVLAGYEEATFMAELGGDCVLIPQPCSAVSFVVLNETEMGFFPVKVRPTLLDEVDAEFDGIKEDWVKYNEENPELYPVVALLVKGTFDSDTDTGENVFVYRGVFLDNLETGTRVFIGKRLPVDNKFAGVKFWLDYAEMEVEINAYVRLSNGMEPLGVTPKYKFHNLRDLSYLLQGYFRSPNVEFKLVDIGFHEVLDQFVTHVYVEGQVVATTNRPIDGFVDRSF